MANETKPVTIAKMRIDPPADIAHAPFVFFDGIATNGVMGGLITVTMTAATMLPDPSDQSVTVATPIPIAYLRTNVLGAIALRDALNNSLSMLEMANASSMQAPQGPAN